MYVTESIKFLPLFVQCTIQQVSDFYTCKALTCTCADCAIILLVQFHHFNEREGRGACVSIVLKFYWSNFILVKMLPSKHGGVAYMQLSCIDSVGTQEVSYMAACSLDKDMFSGEVISVDRVCSFMSVGIKSHYRNVSAARSM